MKHNTTVPPKTRSRTDPNSKSRTPDEQISIKTLTIARPQIQKQNTTDQSQLFQNNNTTNIHNNQTTNTFEKTEIRNQNHGTSQAIRENRARNRIP